jgi:hypothetical protein
VFGKKGNRKVLVTMWLGKEMMKEVFLLPFLALSLSLDNAKHGKIEDEK